MLCGGSIFVYHNRPFSLVKFVFPKQIKTDHVTIPRRFEPLSCSLKSLRASLKMSDSPDYRHMTCIGKIKLTSGKDLSCSVFLLFYFLLAETCEMNILKVFLS